MKTRFKTHNCGELNLSNENQEIVGASTVSSVADEVINLISILIQQKMTLADVEKMIFTYPTVASDLEYFY